ncbi:hypothetical protein VTN96DRAFT_10333 [Rasamsonia emersonii]|uniref:Uncharacterized protein n=1 Tax=Rasamsonia emersonii (strain ATCC 16479 / CBS 393.64 / IMI 116815) TaxID=1408163 RepID=A0A0F4YMX7_RASE3|nr:hypothetical protein T310_6558 [Rasamsonia emersonii CBS 393.64]KKA19460.1 hypothetical protein T310_6558 [Rasamsonia emersonii CBS 393.64]
MFILNTLLLAVLSVAYAVPLTNITGHAAEVSPGLMSVHPALSSTEDLTNVTVDSTYYITWDVDFYPINSSIIIELRYSDNSAGDSAYTSDRTENGYGYVPIKMQKEWLQGKFYNNLTLYIIENNPESGQRTSYREGPTITLLPKPVEHYKPPPPTSFNKLGLVVGLPISLSVIILVVAGLFFGMRKSRQIGLGNVMGPRKNGYGIQQSKIQRLDYRSKDSINRGRVYNTDVYTDNPNHRPVVKVDTELCNEIERTRGHAFTHDVSNFKSWSD